MVKAQAKPLIAPQTPPPEAEQKNSSPEKQKPAPVTTPTASADPVVEEKAPLPPVIQQLAKLQSCAAVIAKGTPETLLGYNPNEAYAKEAEALLPFLDEVKKLPLENQQGIFEEIASPSFKNFIETSGNTRLLKSLDELFFDSQTKPERFVSFVKTYQKTLRIEHYAAERLELLKSNFANEDLLSVLTTRLVNYAKEEIPSTSDFIKVLDQLQSIAPRRCCINNH